MRKYNKNDKMKAKVKKTEIFRYCVVIFTNGAKKTLISIIVALTEVKADLKELKQSSLIFLLFPYFYWPFFEKNK